MNGTPNAIPDGPPPGEDLLAYLDGELDGESRRRLEQRLSSSGELRQRLKEYQQTWDLLDELPRAEVDESFTRTTVEMVAVRVEDLLKKKSEHKDRRRLISWTLGTLGTLAAAALGFWGASQYLASPNEQLVKDLPILEHFDAYRYAGSLDFLQQLQEQNLFQEESGDAI